MGRVPFPFTPSGESLHEMECKSIARARMCVNKSIAEPEKPGPREAKQGGFRGNSIAFPQAKVEFCRSTEYPPSDEEATRFMGEMVTIAMARVNIEDLHKPKWAQVRRGPYINATTFLTRHNKYHNDMTVNHERANASFHAEGHTSDAVLKQAVHISVPENLRSPVTPVRLEGPADTGDAGIDPEHVVSIEGEAVASESEGEVAPNTTIPDPEHPAAALPPMHICADELTGGDLDELQAIR